MRSLFAGVFAALGLVFVTPTAFAETPVDTWVVAPFSIDYDRRGTTDGDYEISGWRLDPQDNEGPHIRFNCSERAGLIAIVSPTPEKQSELGRRFKPRLAKTRLHIEGRKTEVVNWLHIRDTGIMQTRQNKIAKRIFNAVITQAPINVSLPMNEGKMSFSPPPPDDDFKRFIAACGLG